METLILDKYIKTDKGETFDLSVYGELSTLDMERITITFREINGKKIHYLYQTTKEINIETKYTDAIKEAVKDFRENKSLHNLLQF
jgi:hypothetical protein